MGQSGDRPQQMDPSEREMDEHFLYHWESGPVPNLGDCVKLAGGVIAQVEAAHSTNGPYVEARKLVLRRISASEALKLGWVDPEIAR